MDQRQSPATTIIPCNAIPKALILPEVLFLIGSYLNASQALICSKVCSAWYINFAPLVWENLYIGRETGYAIVCKYKYRRELEARIRFTDLASEGCDPDDRLAIIRSKASWLRSFAIQRHASPQQFALGKECTQLQAISITFPLPFNNGYARDYWGNCKAMLKQNRSSLKSLSLEGVTDLYLELTVKDLWYCCSKRIMDLIIADCPRLESLDWTATTFSVARMEQLSNLVAAGRGRIWRLRLSLSLHDGHLTEILQYNKKPLKVMNITLHFIGEEPFQIMKERHFQSLQEVNLSFLTSEQGYMLQDVLALCPSLEIVESFALDTALVQEDKRPSACVGLKEFTMAIEVTKGLPGESQGWMEQRQEQSRVSCAQLARLKNLHYLSLEPRRPRRLPFDKECFSLRLGKGLDLLTAQTQLEVLNLYRCQSMDRNDILWMAKDWTSTRMVSGGLLSGKKAVEEVFKDKYLWDYEHAKILNSHGVKTLKYIRGWVLG
ncbi:unnamed protein product [Mortierella alpina]